MQASRSSRPIAGLRRSSRENSTRTASRPDFRHGKPRTYCRLARSSSALWESAVYSELGDAQLLLSAAQEQALWEEIVAASPWGAQLLSPARASAQCRDAWRLAHAWRIEGALDKFPGNDDARAFAEWAGRLCQANCARHRFGAAAGCRRQTADGAACREAADARRLCVRHIAAADCRFFSRRERRWNRNGAVRTAPQASCNGAARLIPPRATNWRPPRNGRVRGSKRRTIAIRVSPAQPSHASPSSSPISSGAARKSQRVFSRVMDPGLEPARRGRCVRCRSTCRSASALASYPLVACGARHHRARRRARSSSRWRAVLSVRRLLPAPNPSSRDARGSTRICARCCRRGSRSPAWSARSTAAPCCASGAKRFSTMGTRISPACSRRTHGRGIFRSCSRPRAFPASARSIPRNFRRARNGTKCWASSRARARVAAAHVRAGARAVAPPARRHAVPARSPAMRRCRCSASSNPAGLEFDHLWVSGLTDDAWPLPARPNPFIAGRAAEEGRHPGSRSGYSLALDRRITDDWLHAADEVVLSHPLREERPRAAAERADHCGAGR